MSRSLATRAIGHHKIVSDETPSRPLDCNGLKKLNSKIPMKQSFVICVAIAFCICGGSTLRGQTATGVTANVQFSDGSNVSITDFSKPVSAQRNEVVNITIQFPGDAIGDTVVIDSGGGSVSVGNNVLVVGDSGAITFAFHAPAYIGQYPVNIRRGSASVSLQFSVGFGQG
jgi:hypothetical protein